MKGLRWLASYPRSGNTWLRLLLDSFLAGGKLIDINRISSTSGYLYNRSFFDEMIGLSSADLHASEILNLRPAILRAQCEQNMQPMRVKCHDMRRRLPDGDWLIPPDVSLGGVYLVRDPRDVVLSLARFMDKTINEAITTMETAGLIMAKSITRHHHQCPNLWGSWSENVESWLAAEPFPVHVVRYEDLRQDTHRVLSGILNALGLTQDEPRIAAAVAATTLDSLRQQEDAHGFIERSGKHRFFGAGRVAGWREQLTASQVTRIEAAHGPVMRRLGYLA